MLFPHPIHYAFSSLSWKCPSIVIQNISKSGQENMEILGNTILGCIFVFYIIQSVPEGGSVWMAMSWLTWCPKSVMAGGKKFVWKKSPCKKWWMGLVYMCMDSTRIRPCSLLSFFKQSDTQVPLLLLVKAHHSLNIHTTLSGPSASVSELSILSIYLSSLFSLSAPSLLVL